MILSGFGVFVVTLENASGIKGLPAAVKAEKELEELSRYGGHGDGARHAGGFFLMVVGAVKFGAHHEFKHRLREDGAQSGASAFGLSKG